MHEKEGGRVRKREVRRKWKRKRERKRERELYEKFVVGAFYITVLKILPYFPTFSISLSFSLFLSRTLNTSQSTRELLLSDCYRKLRPRACANESRESRNVLADILDNFEVEEHRNFHYAQADTIRLILSSFLC